MTPTHGGKMDTMLLLTEIGFLALQINKKKQYKIIYPNKTKQNRNKIVYGLMLLEKPLFSITKYKQYGFFFKNMVEIHL